MPATVTTHEKIDLLRSRCKEALLAEGSKRTDQIKKLILDSKTDGYLVLYCNCGDGFVFSSNEKIVETLLCEKERVIFRIFSGRQLQLPEIVFYLVHKKLDINGIRSYSRPPDSDTFHSNTRFVF